MFYAVWRVLKQLANSICDHAIDVSRVVDRGNFDERGIRHERLVLLANRHGKWCLALVALAGIAFVSVEAIWQAHINELNPQASVANLAEDALNDRELKGLRRAAWMLGKAFGPRQFSEEQFLKDMKCELRLYGEFRWDEEQQRLVITQHLFHDDIIREKLLLHAQEVLQHSLLTPGFREGIPLVYATV